MFVAMKFHPVIVWILKFEVSLDVTSVRDEADNEVWSSVGTG